MTTRLAARDGMDPVQDALALVDSCGVLSVYLAARDAATPGDAAVHALLVELGRIGRSVEASPTVDPARVRAALATVERHVRGTVLHGEARDLAVFAALGEGEVQVVQPGSAVPTRATLGPRADVRPLCRALDDARPEGLALLSADGVTLLEWTPGALTTVWSETAPELEEPELVGPAHAHPRGSPYAGPGFEVGQQRDLFERRMRDELGRFLVDAGRTTGASSQERGWRTLALAGEERLVAAFTSGVPAGGRLELARIAHLERWRSHGELAHAVAPTFAGVRERREADLVRRALDGGRAALGVRESLAALADARVETLLVAAERRLVDTGEVAPHVAEGEPDEDPMLADRMIGRALETGASVVVLSDGPARLLGDDVAALLRY